MSRARVLVLMGILVGGSGAGGCARVLEDETDDGTTSAQSPLLFPTSCTFAPAHQTLTSGGSFRVTDRSYTAANCTDAYVVQLTNYARIYNFGTMIAYDETPPTTRTTCEQTKLTVSVWEQAASFVTPLGEVTSTGIWYTDPANRNHCRMPRLTLEDSFRAVRPDDARDFRIAIRAYQTSASGFTKKRFAFATVQSQRALSMDLVLASAELLGTPVHGNMWLRKGTPFGDRLCRAAQIDITRMAFGAKSLVNAGAASADVAERNAKYVAMRQQLCASGGTESGLETAARDYLRASIKVRDAIASRFSSQAATLGRNDRAMAEELINRLAKLDLGRLAANCGIKTVDLWNFLNLGTLPTGIAADRLILGTCSASSADTPELVATRLGVGGVLTPTNTQSLLAACLVPTIKGQPTDVCNDPRAEGAATERQTPPPTSDENIPCFQVDHNWVPCASTEKPKQTNLTPAAAAGNMSEAEKEGQVGQATAADPNANRANESAEAEKNADDSSEEEDFWWDLGKAIYKDLKLMPGSNTIIFFLERDQKDTTRDRFDCLSSGPGGGIMCVPLPKPEPVPGPNNPNAPQYCGTDFAPGGWYAAIDSPFGDGSAPRQLNEADRFEHCACAAMEASYAELAGALPGIKTSLACPSKAEKLAHDCIANPSQGDDRPRPECKGFLFPGQIDAATWDARTCAATTCPAGQVKSIVGSGCCGPPPTILSLPGSDCPQGLISNCTPENPESCLCQPVNLGTVPYAGERNCRLEPTAFPGSLERWLLPAPNKVAVHRANNESFVMLSTGTSGRASAVTPTYFRNALERIGTVARPRVMISKAAPSSGTLRLRVYCTNVAAGLFHGDMGQCPLNGLTPGVAASCDITLNGTLSASCLGGAFNLEWVAEAPTSWNGRIGVGGLDFGGTVTATPAAGLAPRCPPPSPNAFFRPAADPLWLDLGGTPDVLSRDFTLASGLLTIVPPTLFERP